MYSSSIGRNNISWALKHLVNAYVVFEQAKAQAASIKIYTPYGQLVASLKTTELKTRRDTKTLQNGLYFYTFQTKGICQSGKLLICK